MKGKKILLFMLVAACILTAKNTVARHNPLLNKYDCAADEELLEWKLDATIGNVDFYYAISKCHDKEVIYLKFVNKNSYKVKISWKELFQSQIKTERRPDKGLNSLTLRPGETIADNCAATSCKECLITTDQINPTYLVKIISFSFREIGVTKEVHE